MKTNEPGELDTDRPPPNQCTATTREGGRCRQLIAPGTDRCVWHGDPEVADDARQRGRDNAVAKRREKAAFSRTVDPADLPGPLENLEDCVRWSSWVARCAASGVLDKFSAHETILAIGSLRQSLKERDYLREIRELQAELARYKKAAPR